MEYPNFRGAIDKIRETITPVMPVTFNVITFEIKEYHQFTRTKENKFFLQFDIFDATLDNFTNLSLNDSQIVYHPAETNYSMPHWIKERPFHSLVVQELIRLSICTSI